MATKQPFREPKLDTAFQNDGDPNPFQDRGGPRYSPDGGVIPSYESGKVPPPSDGGDDDEAA
jgi:hypothetical protein